MPMGSMQGSNNQTKKKFKDLLNETKKKLSQTSSARTIHLDEVDVLLAHAQCEAMMT